MRHSLIKHLSLLTFSVFVCASSLCAMDYQASQHEETTRKLQDCFPKQVPENLSSVYSVAVSPDGKKIAAGSHCIVHLFDFNTGERIKTLPFHEENVNSVAFSPDGTLIASGSWDKTIKIWNGGVTSVAFTPDDKNVVFGTKNDGSVQIWNIEHLIKS